MALRVCEHDKKVQLHTVMCVFYVSNIHRVLLAPVYALCCMVVFTKLCRSRGIVWMLIYAAAVLLTLVPAHLLEFRYFTPAAVVAILNMSEVNN
jgi:hypothetical protein